jgi:hypothetical protein
MDKNRILEIENRLKWLKVELAHKNYLDGYSIIGYEEEFKKLLNELEKIENKKDDGKI